MKVDGELGFSRGVNSSIDPMRLPPDAAQYAVNLAFDSTIPRTRPAFQKMVELSSSGTFQGSAVYHLSGVDHIVYVIDGVVYAMNTVTFQKTTLTGAVLSTGSIKHHFCQAERYMIIQDGADTSSWSSAKWPVILNGMSLYDQSALRASAPYQAVPKGKQMAYCHGRLFVATEYIYANGSWSSNLGNIGFVAGDLIKSSDPDAILSFTETNYLNGGGRIVPVQEIGEITAMTVLRNNPTGTGNGPLVVSWENGWCAYQVDAERSQWFDIELGTVLYTGRDLGCYDEFSYVHANNGLLYLTKEGLRMTHDAMAKASGQNGIDNNPISAEVADILNSNPPASKSVASAIQRVYMTGKATQSSYYDSIVSLNALTFGSISEEAPPIYEGEWTGLKFLQILTEKSEALDYGVYIIAEGVAGEINLAKLVDPDPETERPKCQLFTRYFDFQDPMTGKYLREIELNFFEIDGRVYIQLYYRSDGSSLWGKSRAFSLTASGEKQHIKSLRIPIDNAIDSTSNGSLALGYRFQLCIEWTGVAKLGMFKLFADEDKSIPETKINESGNTGNLQTTSTLVDLSRYTYEATL